MSTRGSPAGSCGCSSNCTGWERRWSSPPTICSSWSSSAFARRLVVGDGQSGGVRRRCRMNELAAKEGRASRRRRRSRRNAPLIPRESVAGARAWSPSSRIMTFLACLHRRRGAARCSTPRRAWRSDVLRELTIQVKPRRATTSRASSPRPSPSPRRRPAVDTRSRLFRQPNCEKLLEPWLGSRASISAHLPIPRLILRRDARASRTDDLDRTARGACRRPSPQASSRRSSGSGRRGSGRWRTRSSGGGSVRC